MSSYEQPLYDCQTPSLDSTEQSVVESIDQDRMWDSVEKFSSLTRISGTGGERKAAEHLTTVLSDHAVSHTVHEPELYLSTPVSATVTATDRTECFKSAKTVAFSDNDSVSGEVIRLHADEEGDSVESLLDHSLNIDDVAVEDKVVVAESLIPIAEIRALAARGAAAFIAIHPHDREPHEGIISPVWGGAPTFEEKNEIPEIIVANISGDDGDKLDALIENNPSLSLTVSTTVDTRWVRCPLIEAEITPTQTATDEFVLLHGHYDSWHVGVTDNATGDAALLEAAIALSAHADQLTRTVRVCWWPGHSTGRYAGSTWYADTFANSLNENCLAHVNVDSPGVKDAVEFTSRVKWMTAAAPVAIGTITDVTGKQTETRRPSRAGDYSFNNIGIAGLSLQSSIEHSVREERGYHLVGGSGGHADAWHLSTDTLEKADPATLKRDADVYTIATYRLASATHCPLDYRLTIAEHQQTLETLKKGSSELGLEKEFSRLEETYSELAAKVNEIYEQENHSFRNLQPLARTLTRINYVTDKTFEQDPAVGRPPLPALAAIAHPPNDTDSKRFLAWGARRSYNALTYELRSVLAQLPAN